MPATHELNKPAHITVTGFRDPAFRQWAAETLDGLGKPGDRLTIDAGQAAPVTFSRSEYRRATASDKQEWMRRLGLWPPPLS